MVEAFFTLYGVKELGAAGSMLFALGFMLMVKTSSGAGSIHQTESGAEINSLV